MVAPQCSASVSEHSNCCLLTLILDTKTVGQVQSGQIVKLGPNLDSLPLLILEKLRAESPTYMWNYIYTFWGVAVLRIQGGTVI